MPTPQDAVNRIRKELKEKTGRLDLRDCGLPELPQEITQLTHLRVLDLSSRRFDRTSPNQIINLAPLSGLSNLTNLDLSGNKIINLAPLSGLSKLTDLDLSLNQIVNLAPLSGLSNLTELYLFGNQIVNLAPLSGLSNLTNLYLTGNQIINLAPLSGLSNLTNLDLSHNQIINLAPLSGLSNLTNLDLSHNQIINLAPLSGLSNLTNLDLSGNQIINLAPLSGLSNLTNLDLSGNQIINLAPLSGLSNLTILELSRNQIINLAPLSGLSNLTNLDLSGNQIINLAPLSGLSNLTSLDLIHNQITDLSPLRGLIDLNSIRLSYNQITDASPLSGLSNLKLLDLRGNQIKRLSLAFVEGSPLKIDVESSYPGDTGIYLSDNPITDPPIEILAEGREAVIEYLLSTDLKPLLECKVIFIGDGGVGKTSLMKRIAFDDFKPDEPMTHGINKLAWRGAQDAQGRAIRVNLWDFGGQHLQHALHQFFFTDRVVYVLVLDPRRESNAKYWLDQVERLGKESKVLVVYNCRDPLDNTIDHMKDFYHLRQSYPYLSDAFTLSCAASETLTQFRNALTQVILGNEGINDKYPQKWFTLKTRLEQEVPIDKHYIDNIQYEQWCEQASYNDLEARKRLLRILNRIGSIVYFDKPGLTEYHILNPEWITTGAYSVLTDSLTAEKKGRLTYADLETIFAKPKEVFSGKDADTGGTSKPAAVRPGRLNAIKQFFSEPQPEPVGNAAPVEITYSKNNFAFIINLMLEYHLCQRSPFDEHVYLIPACFGAEPPRDYARLVAGGRHYRLQFPASFEMLIMHRFIAKNIKHAALGDYWHGGIYFKHAASNTHALVTTNLYSQQIDCIIKGDNILGMWEVVRHSFHDTCSMYHNFAITEWVQYTQGDTTVFLAYQKMLNALYDGVSVIPYDTDTRLKDINVLDVLSLFTDQATIKAMEEKNINLNVTVSPIFTQSQSQTQQLPGAGSGTVRQQLEDIHNSIAALESLYAQNEAWNAKFVECLEALDEVVRSKKEPEVKGKDNRLPEKIKLVKDITDLATKAPQLWSLVNNAWELAKGWVPVNV
jgi:internalin A